MGEQAVGDLGVFGLPASLGFVLAVWFFAVGGAVGSFLNVVVYRLPMGLSLVTPASHCPICKHPIRWHDNVPILGWFLLRGRCRDCRTSIPFRYPLIEAVTALLFLSVGIAGGPVGTASGGLGPMLLLVLYHSLLLATLLAAALIRYDGHPVPHRLFFPAIVVGLLVAAAWPLLRLPLTTTSMFGPQHGWMEGIAGAGVGLVLGHALRLTVIPRDREEMPLGLAVAGLILGGKATLIIGLLVVAIHWKIQALYIMRSTLQRTSPGLWLFVLTWAGVLALPPLVEGLKMP